MIEIVSKKNAAVASEDTDSDQVSGIRLSDRVLMRYSAC